MEEQPLAQHAKARRKVMTQLYREKSDCQYNDPSKKVTRELAPPAAGRSSGSAKGERSEALLYLYSNNSTEEYHKQHENERLLAQCGILTPHHKKQAHTIYLNAERFVSLAPSIDYVGFLTITTPDNCTNYHELQKRWNSFNSHYLKKSPHFRHYLGVKERQDRGALHLHLLVMLAFDIRTGFDWEGYLESNELKKKGKPWRHVASKCYRSASEDLRGLWAELRDVLPRYGFGRSELLPIRTTVEGIARYVGGYLGKHIGQRELRDKGMRLTFADSGWIKNSPKFQFFTDGSREWREKVELFAMVLKCSDFSDLHERLGPGWCHRYKREILEIKETLDNLEEAPF